VVSHFRIKVRIPPLVAVKNSVQAIPLLYDGNIRTVPIRTMEIDHLFICVKPGGSEAKEIAEFGLIEGSANRHPGQGTANRRFLGSPEM
jgi:hypothetical protein